MSPFDARAPDDILVAPGSLEKRVTCLFVALGCNVTNARTIAAHLVGANLRGHDSHGISLIPLYARMVSEGKVDPVREIEIREITPAILVANAGRGFGQVSAMQAIARAISACKATGFTLLALRDSHHVGRIGHYAEQCADAGFASIHFVNVVGLPPCVAPWGGAEARLHTNPMALGVPRGNAPPLVLDFATSRVAQGKMRIAAARGRTIPEGFLVDQRGRPSTDPSLASGSDGAPSGALMPFGEYKGFGLGLLCDVLAGAVAGGRSLHPGTTGDGLCVNNMLSILIDMDRLSAPDSRDSEIGALVEYLRSSTRTAEGPVRLPGDGSRARMADREENGIPVDRETWAAVTAIFDQHYV